MISQTQKIISTFRSFLSKSFKLQDKSTCLLEAEWISSNFEQLIYHSKNTAFFKLLNTWEGTIFFLNKWNFVCVPPFGISHYIWELFFFSKGQPSVSLQELGGICLTVGNKGQNGSRFHQALATVENAVTSKYHNDLKVKLWHFL